MQNMFDLHSIYYSKGTLSTNFYCIKLDLKLSQLTSVWLYWSWLFIFQKLIFLNDCHKPPISFEMSNSFEWIQRINDYCSCHFSLILMIMSDRRCKTWKCEEFLLGYIGVFDLDRFERISNEFLTSTECHWMERDCISWYIMYWILISWDSSQITNGLEKLLKLVLVVH